MQSNVPSHRSRTHVFIIDGTLSRIEDGDETNAGLLYKLLDEYPDQVRQTVAYHPGVQASGLRKWLDVAAGTGINQSILEGYAVLSSKYHQGDKIMLFGFSRGAYAVRSLAGFISRIGMLRKEEATQRRIARAFRYYEATTPTPAAKAFCNQYCHQNVEIEVLGVWDTVKALGLPYPILNRLAPMATEFHDHSLSDNTRNAFQALAIDENRTSYTPLPWRIKPGYTGHMEQLWFPGAHADVGGHINNRPAARPLSNIPFVWMLERAEKCGLGLPENWRSEFPQNAGAPMHGAYRGSAKFFIARAPRMVGKCASEAIHASVDDRKRLLPRYRPKAALASATEVSGTTKQEHIQGAQQRRSAT